MTREECKELLPIIEHFAHGGNIWQYSTAHNKWYKQNYIYPDDISRPTVIEDKHFETRKAYALGEEVQVRQGNDFSDIRVPLWEQREGSEYRPKPKSIYKGECNG